MNVQTLIVALIVLGAVFYFGRKIRRAVSGKGDGGCDKCSK